MNFLTFQKSLPFFFQKSQISQPRHQKRTGADDLNGFLSQGLGFISTAMTVPFIPAIMAKIGRRATMFLGGAAYASYILVYIHPILEFAINSIQPQNSK